MLIYNPDVKISSIVRINQDEIDKWRKTITKGEHQHINKIKRSIQNNGYDKKKPIILSRKHGYILDGIHRLEAVKMLGQKRIPAVYRDSVPHKNPNSDTYFTSLMYTAMAIEDALKESKYSGTYYGGAIRDRLSELYRYVEEDTDLSDEEKLEIQKVIVNNAEINAKWSQGLYSYKGEGKDIKFNKINRPKRNKKNRNPTNQAKYVLAGIVIISAIKLFSSMVQ